MHRNFTYCYAQRSLMAMLWLLLPCIYSFAQRSAQPGRNVTLTNARISLGEVFNIIEKQTGVLLFFGELNVDQTVGVKFVSTPVEEALGKILPPIGLTYEYVKGNRDKIFIKSVMPTKKDTVMMTSISGVVTDEKGEPLPGATVRIKGTQVGTATKANGSFMLHRTGDKDVLVISFTGFDMAEVSVGTQANVKVQLKPGENSLGEQVVTAYGVTERKAITGAITVVKGEQIRNLPNRSFDKSLQGLVPGLLVTQGTGQPGGGVSNFVLRGIATAVDPFNGAVVRNPLIIIDGIPISQEQSQIYSRELSVPISNPLSQINPSDIESISVLKDASAIALYGARASNGVIVVTTKRGHAGKAKFSVRSQADLATRLKGKTKPLNQDEYLELLYETYKNSNPDVWTDKTIRADLLSKFPYEVRTNNDTAFLPASDWYGELYDNSALTLSNEISISGGSGQTSYYLNGEYTKQDGIIRGTGYDRKSLRFNFETYPVKSLKIGINTALSYSEQHYANSLRALEDPATIATLSPLNPVRKNSGDYIYNYYWGALTTPQANPAAASELNTNKNAAFRGITKIYGEVAFLRKFKFTSNLGLDFMQSESKEKVDPRLYDMATGAMAGRIEELSVRRANIISTNVLSFNSLFDGVHNLGLIVGHEAQMLNQKNLSVGVKGLALPYYDQINSPGVSVISRSGFINRETLLSYFSQASYAYKDKYFLSASVRTDGSSRFGDDEQFGTYWSTGGGWVLSSESFFDPLKRVLNYFKLRGSVGAAGNASSIDRFTRFDKLQATTFLNQTAVYPQSSAMPGNKDVKWERTFTWDVAFDIRLFNDRLSLTADLYERKTSDMLYVVNLPRNAGYSSILANIGRMQNKGVEVSISADLIKSKAFRWNVSGNYSTNKNRLVQANTKLAATTSGVLANQEGENFNSFYLYKWAGVNPENGKPQWYDSAGKPTSDYNLAKREFVGKPQPTGFGMLTNTFVYRNFDLSVSFYYQYGCKVYNADVLVSDGMYPYLNQDKRALNRWQKPGDIADNPQRLLNDPNAGAGLPSTRYLFDGSYIRLQDLTFSYTVPGTTIKGIHIDNIRVFVQGNNLAVWTRYPGEDPSTANVAGYTSLTYPSQRTYSFGANVNF